MTKVLSDAPPQAMKLAPDRLAAMDRQLVDFVENGELAGVDVLVARHGRAVHRFRYGFADLAARRPLEDDTIYRIYSMTKPVTAVAMMVLHERGLWAPDDPIVAHLPEFANLMGPDGHPPRHPPTMRELMTHTAGFGYGLGGGDLDATDAAYITAGVWAAESLADMAARVATVPLALQPGAAWRYSLSMDLQGAVIERLSGQSLSDFMRTTIFEPLGMTDTEFYVPAEKLPRLASFYHKFGADQLTAFEQPVFLGDPGERPNVPSGGGGLYSTMADYATFAQMLLGQGRAGDVRVLKPESVALMTANHLPDDIVANEVVSGFQRVGPGRGYGFNGAVFFDPLAAGSPVGRGTYQWDGASGVWFWIDPENDLLFVGMIQRLLQDGMPRLQDLTQAWVAEALAGEGGATSSA